MKILLIFPPKEHYCMKQNELPKKIEEESGSYPPLGLLYIASYLKKSSVHEVQIIDCPAEQIGYKDLEQRIRTSKPELVGIYFCTDYLLDAVFAAELAKKINKNSIVVAGGPHVFIYPEETAAIPSVDYCVYGEGEIVFSKLADYVSEKKDPSLIDGIISKSNSAKKQQLQKIENLDALPFPDRAMLKIDRYQSFITYANPITTMMTSRGCAYNCYYCNNIEKAQKVRLRSAQSVVAEIENIISLGIRDIIFFDENFTFDMKRVESICDEIIKKKLRVRWQCRSRADMKFSEAILRKMKKAGCRMIQLGIETGSQRLQEVINKKLDLGKVREVVQMIKKAGILVYGNFIIGLPTETECETSATIGYAVSLGLDYAPFSLFTPLPESVFYENALNNGIIRKDHWREFVKNPGVLIENHLWPQYDQYRLQDYYSQAFRKFYFRPSYLLKSLFRKQSLKQKFWQLKTALKLFM